MSNLLLTYTRREVTNIMMEDFFSKMTGDNDPDVSLRAIPSCDLSANDITWSDIILAVRPQGSFIADILRIGHRLGKLTVSMIDDDFFAIKGFYAREMHGVRALRKSLKYSDVVISSNETLLGKLLKYTDNAKGIIIQTGVHEEEIKHSDMKERDVINIAYYSNTDDDVSFKAYIVPILGKLSELYENRIEWTFFHVHPDVSGTPYEDKATYLSKMPLNEFRGRLGDGTIDIGIMPLMDNEFNRSKYVNHFFEYTRAGIPGIYSKVEPYASFIENGFDGLLCENTDEGWIEAISEMMDFGNRRRIAHNAQKELEEKYSMTEIYNKLIVDFPELHNYSSDHVGGVFSLNAAKAADMLDGKIFKPTVWFVHIILSGHIFTMVRNVMRRIISKQRRLHLK